MRIRDDLAAKYWLMAAQEEVALALEDEGYAVERETLLGSWRADLVARLGERLRVYEFKTRGWPQERVRRAQELRNYVVHKKHGEFNLVWVTPPIEREIEINDLEAKLASCLEKNLRSELDALSTHTRVEEISDTEVDSIRMEPGRTTVRGQALATVELQYGSGGDQERGDGLLETDSFPMSFEVVLDQDLRVAEVRQLTIDTTDFYA